MELSKQLAAYIFEMQNSQFIVDDRGSFFTDGIEFYQGDEPNTLSKHNLLRSEKLTKLIKQAVTSEKLCSKGKESISVSEVKEQLNAAIKILRDKQEVLASSSGEDYDLETSLNLSLYGRNADCLLEIMEVFPENQPVKGNPAPLTVAPLAGIDCILRWYKEFGEEATGDEYPLWLDRFYHKEERLPAIEFENRFKIRIYAMVRLVQLLPNIDPNAQHLSKIRAPRRDFSFDSYVELRWGIKSYKQFISDNESSIIKAMENLWEKNNEVESKNEKSPSKKYTATY